MKINVEIRNREDDKVAAGIISVDTDDPMTLRILKGLIDQI